MEFHSHEKSFSMYVVTTNILYYHRYISCINKNCTSIAFYYVNHLINSIVGIISELETIMV